MTVHPCHWHAWARTLTLLACSLLLAAPALAAEPVGRVLATKGTVTATDRDDFERPLSRNDVVYPGETLRTGPSGRIQVRFRDDALMDLKPDTEFDIERYEEPTQDEGGSAVMSLITGALRTITGAIGQREEDEYTVDTPVATIGIRGTDYSLDFCDADCAGEDGTPGLFGRVDDGTLIAQSGAGTGTFSAGDYFFVGQSGAPQRIIAPPEGVMVDDAEEEEQSEDASETDEALGSENGGGRAEGPPEDLLSDGRTTVDVYDEGYEAGADQTLSSAAPLDAFAGFLFPTALLSEDDIDDRTGLLYPDGFESDFLELAGGAAYTDDDGRIVGVEDDSHGFSVESAEFVDSGRVTGNDFSVDWGQWSGEYLFDGERISGDFAYAYTEDLTNPAELPASGQFSFTYSGGPDVLDTSGNTWNVDRLSMGVDFANLTVDTFNLQLSGAVTLQFSQPEPAPIVDGVISSELNEVEGLGTGYYSGGFLGGNAEGAMLIFHVDTTDHTIDGIGVLE